MVMVMVMVIVWQAGDRRHGDGDVESGFRWEWQDNKMTLMKIEWQMKNSWLFLRGKSDDDDEDHGDDCDDDDDDET